MQTYRIGATAIVLHEGGLTETIIAGKSVPALAQDNAEYRARAVELGYGADTARMSREHEILHSILAAALCIGPSPSLLSVSQGTEGRGWAVEEEMVLAAQKFCNRTGTDVMELLRLYAAQPA